MNKIYTFAALLMAGVTGLSGGAQVYAQSIQNTSNDSPYVNNENCSISNSGSSSSDTANTNENTIPIGGTISYQGGSTSPISTDTSIYPTISYTPRITTSDATFSIQDTTSVTLSKDTLAYPTKIYASSTTTTDNTISFQDTASFSLNATGTSSYPKLSVTSDTTLSYPSINYQIHDPITNETVSVDSSSTCTAPIDSENITVNEPIIVNLPSISADLSVNNAYILYVKYGDSATVKWESTGTSSCSLDPIGQSGTEGQYVLQDMTSNMIITIDCEAGPGYAKYQISPSWLGRVEVKVLPPTFDYLKAYLSQIQPSGNKKVNLNSTSNFIDQAQKASKTALAQSFLQKSVDGLKQNAKGSISSAQITKYENAVNYLSKTLAVKVVITTDGCSVTATGPSGLILQYGANENMRRGYGEETVIPESGTVTATIYAPNGFTSTGEVIDSNGVIYARDTQDVTTDDCPEPPTEPEIVTNGGYPSLWADAPINTIIDNWGFFNRQSTSYAAFKVSQSGRAMPYGFGSAKQWPAYATNAGIPVDTNPQEGDVAINISGYYGHAMYVEEVLSDGGVRVSEYDSSGSYNERTFIPDSTNYRFIHFQP